MRKVHQNYVQQPLSSTAFSAEKTQQIEYALQQLASQGISTAELEAFLKQKKDAPQIPLSIFANDNLAPLQGLVKYLKENLSYENHAIARLLGRSQKTIWQSYAEAVRYFPEHLAYEPDSQQIPLSIFHPSKLTVFEQLVLYLKDNLNQTYSAIGKLLRRDQRTIWTVYRRALAKRGGQ